MTDELNENIVVIGKVTVLKRTFEMCRDYVEICMEGTADTDDILQFAMCQLELAALSALYRKLYPPTMESMMVQAKISIALLGLDGTDTDSRGGE